MDAILILAGIGLLILAQILMLLLLTDMHPGIYALLSGVGIILFFAGSFIY